MRQRFALREAAKTTSRRPQRRRGRPRGATVTRPASAGGWRLSIDRGGTFTDIVASDPAGGIHALKVLSRDPAHAGDPAVRGLGELLSRHAPAGARIESVRFGTTVATNALLERKGEPTLLVVTRGFRDALRIGHQHRPDIFAREIRLPPRLYADAIEANERVAADGTVLEPLDEAALTRELARARATGLARRGHRVPARRAQPRARAARGGARARRRLRGDRRLPRRGTARRAHRSWRQRRRRRVPLAGAAALPLRHSGWNSARGTGSRRCC